MPTTYTRETTVSVPKFSRQQEGEEVVIGNPMTGIFVSVSPDVVELLDLLAAGKTLGQISDLYLESTGVTPDLEDLLTLLQMKGFVQPSTTGVPAIEAQAVAGGQPRYHFGTLSQSLAHFLFSGPVLTAQALLVGLALAALIHYPALMPVPADLVFFEHRAYSWTWLTAFTYAGIFLHEMAHLVAARSVGVKSRMAISHRMWYLVAETDLTGLWSVPRRQRYLPMLAGMITDATVTALLILVMFAEQQHFVSFSPLTLHLLRSMVFTNLMRVFWEFFLFVRTDIYFIAVTFLNCKNLLVDTRDYLNNQMSRLITGIRRVDQSNIPPAEHRAIRGYAVLFLIGRAWAFTTLFWVTIPVCIGYWGSLIPALRAGYHANPSEFLDSLAASTYFLIPTVAGFVFWGAALIRARGVQNA